MIPALVLTAGLATRLQPLSLVRAKAALPVAGESLIRRILRYLAAADVSDVVLNLYHLPHTLTAAIGDGSDLNVRVRYSWETPVLGSAGGPKRALPLLLPPSPFLIVNGDTLTDVDIPALIDDHRRSDALVTLAVVPNVEPEKYGGILADADGSFTGVVPRGSQQRSFHFIGVQVARPEAFASIPDNTPYESLRTLYPALIAAQPGCVRISVSSAEFLDIGAPADYLETSLFIADREQRGASVGVGAHIDPSARVERSILWDDVDVGAGVVLKECVVTDGVRVPSDTSWLGVTLRVAQGKIMPKVRVIDGLAIGPID